MDLETLKVDSQYQVKLDADKNEVVTTAVFNPNGINFAVGTSLGNVLFGGVKLDAQGKVKFTIGKVENFTKT